MKLKELQDLIGTDVTIEFDGLKVAVVVVDAKVSYGKPRLLISPVAGEGTVWVDARRAEGI